MIKRGKANYLCALESRDYALEPCYVGNSDSMYASEER